MAVAGAVVSPTFSVVVVAVAVAPALLRATIKNKSRVARLPQLLRILVTVVIASLCIAVGDVASLFDILMLLRRFLSTGSRTRLCAFTLPPSTNLPVYVRECSIQRQRSGRSPESGGISRNGMDWTGLGDRHTASLDKCPNGGSYHAPKPARYS